MCGFWEFHEKLSRKTGLEEGEMINHNSLCLAAADVTTTPWFEEQDGRLLRELRRAVDKRFSRVSELNLLPHGYQIQLIRAETLNGRISSGNRADKTRNQRLEGMSVLPGS